MYDSYNNNKVLPAFYSYRFLVPTLLCVYVQTLDLFY